MADTDLIARLDDRLDQLVNIDMGERGVEALFNAARALQGGSLVGAAAEALMAVPENGTVVLTTGSVSRAWITPELGENDGPSGAAAIARALVLGRNATCVVVCPPYPVDDAEGAAEAPKMLDALEPDLLFSTERVGRNEYGIYHSMRGIDYGMGRARVDFLFDEALTRGIPVVAVGDGGNEIGMGKVADHVCTHVPYGDKCQCGLTKVFESVGSSGFIRVYVG